MIAALLVSHPGVAYECVKMVNADQCDPEVCRIPDGTGITYRVLASDFLAAEQSEIDEAADAWAAGIQQLNRGVDWIYTRGADVTDWGHANFRFDVAAEDQAWFDEHDSPDGAAFVWVGYWGWPACSIREQDMVFNSSLSWTILLPSNISVSDLHSIGGVALHEWGHALGLDHTERTLGGANAMMDVGAEKVIARGSELGERLRVSEDDYQGLVAYHDDTSGSTGKYLMLAVAGVRSSSASIKEFWDENVDPGIPNTVGTWEACEGDVLTAAGTGPEDIYLHMTGTASPLADVLVEWTFSEDQICGDDDDVVVGSQVIASLGVNQPAEVGPPAWDIPFVLGFTDVQRWVCATVDPNDDYSETSSDDNTVRSDRQFTIHQSTTCLP